MSLTNQDVMQLFSMVKFPADQASIEFPLEGEKITVALQNQTGKLKFQGDVSRMNKIANKITYQLRHNKIYLLRRLDINAGHRNPPGPAPDPLFLGYEDYLFLNEDHVHLYIEGYNEKWALPLTKLPEIGITPKDTLVDKMTKFFNYCNIQNVTISSQLSFF